MTHRRPATTVPKGSIRRGWFHSQHEKGDIYHETLVARSIDIRKFENMDEGDEMLAGDDWWYDNFADSDGFPKNEREEQSPRVQINSDGSIEEEIDMNAILEGRYKRTRAQRPLTSSSMIRSWTPPNLMTEQTIKKKQIVFSPIVVRSNKYGKQRGDQFWKLSKYRKFVNMYERDRPLFTSRTRWAGTKLMEVIVATRSEPLPSRLRTMVSADLLLLLKSDLTKQMSYLNDAVVQDLQSSIFPGVHPVGNSKGCANIPCGICDAIAKGFYCSRCNKRFCNECFLLLKVCDTCVEPIVESTCEVRAALHPFNYPPGSKQLLDQFKLPNFMSFQTWFEYNNELLQSYRYEVGFDPMKREMERKMAEERRQNIAVLNRSTKRWQTSIIGVIFRRWRDVLTKVKGAQQRMIKLFHKLKGIDTRIVFHAWKTLHNRGSIEPMENKTISMVQRMLELQHQNKYVANRVDVLQQRKNMAMETMQAVAMELAQADEDLAQPWRQPKTMQNLLHSLIEPCRKLLPRVRRQSLSCANELSRGGHGTHRLSSFVHDDKILEKFCQWDSPQELETNTPHEDEDTAFPFHTRVARLLVAWELHCISGGDVNALDPSLSERKEPITQYEDLLGGERYLRLLAEIAELHNFPPSFNAEEKLDLTRIVSLGMDERCNLIIETTAALNPPVRLLELEELYPDEVDPTGVSPRKELAGGANLGIKKKKRAKIQRKLTTIYKGQKVEIEDDTEQRHFAFLAQLFSLHKGFPSGSPLPGDKKWDGDALDDLLRYFSTAEEATKIIHSRSAPRIRFTDVLPDIALPVGTIAKYEESLVSPLLEVSRRFKDCLKDRKQMQEYENRLAYLSWASIYLSLLGRNTTVEEDIDDGSFTGLEEAQIADLFKKLPSEDKSGSRGLTTREISDVMSRLKEFLVFHLRNSRQIFEHYSASGHGGEKGTMDRSEYWRMVKDIGMHKLMSSADIDLLFQKANIDYAKTGTERVADVDAELQPIEFIEVLCRLSYEKYKTKDLLYRLESLYQNDLLPNAQAADKNAFQSMLLNPRLKKIIAQNKRKLRKLFAIYAAGGGQGGLSSSGGYGSGDVNQVSTISPGELVKMCRDLKLIGVGKVLSDSVIRRIFAHVQQDDDGAGGDEDDSEMVFEEFTDILVVFTCFTDADPYYPLEKKVERFLDVLFEEASKIGLRLV